ncbi:hypothetical protein RJ639_001557 [Escallonia herrerae]|uniref:RNase H type-1 domain-containing protein n=1 Tax=Escallonia herrerae TaxID=1293975 RepID=A0AA88XH23_9ASTE|nr:hypothetical protein RJ639_001557 [Escallonia herrerae]
MSLSGHTRKCRVLILRSLVHHFAVKSGVCLAKQAQCRFYLKVVLEIEVEINQLIEAGFIREVKLTKTKLKYNSIEKTCLALVFASQKLKQYFLAYTVHLTGKADILKYVMVKTVLSGSLARRSILFNEFKIVYVTMTAIKGQALVNFLVDHPIPVDWEISEDFPDEEAFMLGEKCSNNVVEYQALIIGLQMALELGIPSLAVSGDSKLIINQLFKEYEVKKEDLVPYFRYR